MTRWRAWRAVGLTGPRSWRDPLVVVLPLLIALWPLAFGMTTTVSGLLLVLLLELPNSFCEEALFRGVVVPLVVITTLFGIGYAAVRIRTGSLWLPLALHVGWNVSQGVGNAIGVLGEGPATIVLLCSALVMPAYGLYIVRGSRVTA